MTSTPSARIPSPRTPAAARGAFSAAFVVFGAWGFSGCGADEDGPEGGDSPQLGDDDIVFEGDDDGGKPLPPTLDGGRTGLTDEQLQSIFEAECTGWAGEGESLPATLQIVIDVSGSMNLQPPGQDGGPSKWEITRDALQTAVDSLPPTVAMGVVYYPNQTVTSNSSSDPGATSDCVNTDAALSIAPLGSMGSEQRLAFSQSLAGVNVDSYTATHDAYSYALNEHLVVYQGPNKFLLLITDGAPTIDLGCVWPVEPAHVGLTEYGIGSYDGETAPIISDIAGALMEHDVRTFVIGSPGSQESENNQEDMRPWLSEAAVAGGTSASGCAVEGPNYCHFDMTESLDFAAALTDGLASIAAKIVDRCTYQIPKAPNNQTIDPELTQLIIEWSNGENSLIHGDGNGDCTDGWMYEPETQAIELCSETCAQVTADEKARVRVSFGCSQEDVDILVR